MAANALITAVVLSAKPYVRSWPGISVLPWYSLIKNAADLQCARFESITLVQTPFFFFLDDDDDLPDDYLDVLEQCMRREAPLAYTDELVNGTLVRSQAYSRESHYQNPLLVHHLALYRTPNAIKVVMSLPRGHYCPEFMLSWAVANEGASYIPRIGYHWRKGRHGMHRWPCTVLSQARALLWAKGHG